MGKKVKILRRNRKLSAAARVENVRGQKLQLSDIQLKKFPAQEMWVIEILVLTHNLHSPKMEDFQLQILFLVKNAVTKIFFFGKTQLTGGMPYFLCFPCRDADVSMKI